MRLSCPEVPREGCDRVAGFSSSNPQKHAVIPNLGALQACTDPRHTLAPADCGPESLALLYHSPVTVVLQHVDGAYLTLN